MPKVGRFGLSICYDIWFPETTRTLTSAGVEVLIHPVLTGTTDRHAEIAIVQATAAMFQCYVVDVNGLDAGGVGRSLVADPTGHIVYQAGQTAGDLSDNARSRPCASGTRERREWPRPSVKVMA